MSCHKLNLTKTITQQEKFFGFLFSKLSNFQTKKKTIFLSLQEIIDCAKGKLQ